MDNVQLSKANQVYISQQAQNKNTTSPIQPQVQQVEDGENKMNKVLLGLGILGAAAIGITCAIRGKKLKNTPDKEDIQKLIKKFDEISFNKQGIAKLKDGTLFTGTVEKASNNGDKISMEYVDGVLKKSTKTTKGSEIIKEYTNGVVTKKNGQTVDIKKVHDEVKKDQEKLNQLLKNDELSADDFKKQADEIKFKSNNNKKAIEETFDKKVKAQEDAKAEADRLAQEAKEKAQKEEAERLAKEQQEAAAKAQKEELIQIEYNIETMSLEELQVYEKELNKEIIGITKKYSSYSIPADYTEDDYKMYLELTAKKTGVTEKIKKIIEDRNFRALSEKLDLTTNTTAKSLESGKSIDVTLSKTAPINGGAYRINANSDGKILGLAEVSTPQKDILIYNLPEGYAQNSLELKYLSSSSEAKGTGTEIIKQVIEDSKKLGYDGKVWVEACGGSLPSEMARLAGDKYKTSPVPFYYKLGFRFKDEKLNELARLGLKNLQNGLEYNGPQEGIMFLP